ncbi:MAG: methyltransferase domain-containing protein [Calditrichaceae bacterium]
MMDHQKEKQRLIKTIRRELDAYADSDEAGRQIDRIIEAIQAVDRRYFVENSGYAYLNKALPIGNDQTISQPYTVARFLQLANIMPGIDVLDVGSGSGWNACLAAYLCYPGNILSIERIPDLCEEAEKNTKHFLNSINVDNRKISKRLEKLRYKTANIFNLDEFENKYDKIIISAGIPPLKEEMLLGPAKKLLKNNGRFICPYMSGPVIIMDKTDNIIKTGYSADTFAFVPLILP